MRRKWDYITLERTNNTMKSNESRLCSIQFGFGARASRRLRRRLYKDFIYSKAALTLDLSPCNVNNSVFFRRQNRLFVSFQFRHTVSGRCCIYITPGQRMRHLTKLDFLIAKANYEQKEQPHFKLEAENFEVMSYFIRRRADTQCTSLLRRSIWSLPHTHSPASAAHNTSIWLVLLRHINHSDGLGVKV